MLDDIRGRIFLIEEKVRHVRTAEGVRKYNLPIGSPIVQRAKKIKARVVSGKPIHRSVQSAEKPDVFADRRDSAGIYWREPVPKEKLGGITSVGHLADGRVVSIRKAESSGGTTKYAPIIRDKDGYSSDYGPLQKTDKAAREWLKNRITEEEAKKPKRVTRDYAHLLDHHTGVYGYDWTWGDESEADLDGSEASRRKLAIRESEELGISINRSVDAGEVDVATHENINSMMRAYEEMYPGFAAFIPNFNLDRTEGGVVAYNRLRKTTFRSGGYTTIDGRVSPPQMSKYPALGADGSERDWDHTEIGMGTRYFAKGFDERDIANSAYMNGDLKWWAVDARQVAKDNDMAGWQIAQLGTLNHEVGHTVGRSRGGSRTRRTESCSWASGVSRRKFP